MENNVCLFVPKTNVYETIHPVNFVLERKVQLKKEFTTPFMHAVHCVLSGEGIFHTQNHSFPVKKGDVFFILPNVPYIIESCKDFEYGYVTYIGTRANELTEKFKLHKNYVFRDFDSLADVWHSALTHGTKFSDLLSESIVLYTFAQIGNKYFSDEDLSSGTTPPPLVKKYIDENFADPELSLKKISQVFSYNPKYVSMIFKKQYNMGISDYISTIRIQNACNYIERGITAVNNLSTLCGFNDPLYFSKVFKSKIGSSPKTYIKNFLKK